MAKEIASAHPFRVNHDIQCAVTDCHVATTVNGPVVPAGWTEAEQGLICPRHKQVVVVEDTLGDDVIEEALLMNQ